MITVLLYILSILLIATAFGMVFLTLRIRRGFFFGVFSTSASFLLSTVISIYRANLISGTSVISVYIDEVFSSIDSMLSSLSAQQLSQLFRASSIEDISKIKDSLLFYSSSLKEVYTAIFPSVLILNTLFISYLIYMLAKQIMALFKRDVSMLPKFSELKLRRSAAFMLAVSFLLTNMIKNELISAAFSNIGVILTGVAFMCGFSLIDFWVRKTVKSAWIRFAAYIAAAFILSQGIWIAGLVFVFAAAADSVLNFRRLHIREVRDNGQ